MDMLQLGYMETTSIAGRSQQRIVVLDYTYEKPSQLHIENRYFFCFMIFIVLVNILFIFFFSFTFSFMFFFYHFIFHFFIVLSFYFSFFSFFIIFFFIFYHFSSCFLPVVQKKSEKKCNFPRVLFIFLNMF